MFPTQHSAQGIRGDDEDDDEEGDEDDDEGDEDDDDEGDEDDDELERDLGSHLASPGCPPVAN